MSFDNLRPKIDALVKRMKGTDEADALAAGEEFIAVILPELQNQGYKADHGDVLGISRIGCLNWLNRLTKQYNDLKARYDKDILQFRSELASLESLVKFVESKEVS